MHLERRLQRALPLPLEVWVPEARWDHRTQVEFLTRLVEQILEVHLAFLDRLLKQELAVHLEFLDRLVELELAVHLAFPQPARLLEQVLEVHLVFLLVRLVEEVLEAHLAFLLRLGLLLKTDSRSKCSFGLVVMKSTPNN